MPLDRDRPVPWWVWAMISAVMEMAVSSGVRAPRSSPIGELRRLSRPAVTPASRSRWLRSSYVRRDLIAPTWATG
ncbi:hypothetical protein ASE41_02680 [Streptomyces sp. Root264]|nr:hypothetical protein ASE41_02680 [Streptomyces sp. Root264]